MIKSKFQRRPWQFFDWLALGLCIISFGVIFSLLIYKYRIFGYWDWDLALFSQGMHVISHGKSYMSMFGCNLLGNHANFIAYLLIPFFKIFPSPIFLLFLKSAVYGASAFILYTLARNILNSPRGAVIFLLLYIFYPPNLYAQFLEFDFENFAPLFFLLLFYFFRANNWVGFYLTAIGTILIKENMPLVVAMFGIYGLFTKRPKWLWGIVPLVVGFGVTYALVRFIIPFLGSGNINTPYIYSINYQYLGNGTGEIFKNILSYPIDFLRLVTDESRCQWLITIFSEFIILPFFSPQILMLGAPLLAQHFFSNVEHEHQIFYHYVYTISPFIFLATIQSLSHYKNYDRRQYTLIFFLIVFLGFWNFKVNIPDLKMRFFPSGYSEIRHLVPIKSALLRSIPAHAPVVASFCFLPALSQRDSLYAFYKIYARNYQDSQWPFHLPEDVKFALVDLGEAWIDREYKENFSLSQPKIENFFNQGWAVKKSIEDLAFFEKGLKQTKFLVKHSYEPLGTPLKVFDATIDQSFKLLGVDIKEFEPVDQILPLTFYWKADTDIDQQYIITIVVEKDQQRILWRVHRIGYALHPTRVWRKGEMIKEQFNMYWPGGPVDGAILSVRFYKLFFPLDLDETRGEEVKIQGEGLPDEGSKSLTLINFSLPGKDGLK